MKLWLAKIVMPIEFKDACLFLSAPYEGKPRLSLKQPCERKSNQEQYPQFKGMSF